jgi:hypothetical protein
MREVLAAGEESYESAALCSDVVSNGATQHWIPRFERVENGSLRDLTRNLERDFAIDVRELAQVCGERDSNHDFTLLS